MVYRDELSALDKKPPPPAFHMHKVTRSLHTIANKNANHSTCLSAEVFLEGIPRCCGTDRGVPEVAQLQ